MPFKQSDESKSRDEKILNYLTEQRENGCTFANLCKGVGLTPAIVSPALKRLMKKGFVQNPARGLYVAK